jgi:probable rRNA maturation factor
VAAVGDPSRPRLGRPRRVGGPGEPEVFVADEQTTVPVEVDRWGALAEAVLRAEGVRGDAELSLLFIDRTAMAELNEQYLGKPGPTDVLAFPIDADQIEVDDGPGPERRGPDRPPPDPSDQPLLLGDVVVCPEVAVEQAPEHAGTADDELALLVVHGVLHVLGYDHDTPEETQRMRAREVALLETHHWHGPAPTGFRQDHGDEP